VLDFEWGESNEKIKMVLPVEGKIKLHGSSHVCHESIADFNCGLHYEADMKRLDDVQEIQNEPIGGIKLDVENFEFFVLKGGENILRKNKPIVYTELWENQNRINCIDFMLALGYECKQFCKGKLVDYDKCPSVSQNFFFIPIE
ncbi:MAG: FkbM family methyltransferase, partial [Bacteroidales bacterium]|nr:FkbM family methyltransferase [Bacteroidales bacterium]